MEVCAVYRDGIGDAVCIVPGDVVLNGLVLGSGYLRILADLHHWNFPGAGVDITDAAEEA